MLNTSVKTEVRICRHQKGKGRRQETYGLVIFIGRTNPFFHALTGFPPLRAYVSSAETVGESDVDELYLTTGKDRGLLLTYHYYGRGEYRIYIGTKLIPLASNPGSIKIPALYSPRTTKVLSPRLALELPDGLIDWEAVKRRNLWDILG